MTQRLGRAYQMEVADTIQRQIGLPALMSLGASSFTATENANGLMCDAAPRDMPGLSFIARIIQFRADETRGSAVRAMTVMVQLAPDDLYTVTVAHWRLTQGTLTWTTHYRQEGVYCDQLSALMLALDWDGPEPLNPRVL